MLFCATKRPATVFELNNNNNNIDDDDDETPFPARFLSMLFNRVCSFFSQPFSLLISQMRNTQ